MITPSHEQITAAATWTELFVALGINPRNDRACKKVKDWIRANDPAPHLERYRANNYKFSDDKFRIAVAEAVSIRDALKRCGLNAVGAAYTTFKRRCAELDLDTSHFLGQAAKRGKAGKKRPIEEYLVNNGTHIQTHKLKNRLIAAGLKEHRCEVCGIVEWCGKPTPIALDHIDGNTTNNLITNLRIICPNCHAQTETFCGKNIGK
jgi:hypothetical protein